MHNNSAESQSSKAFRSKGQISTGQVWKQSQVSLVEWFNREKASGVPLPQSTDLDKICTLTQDRSAAIHEKSLFPSFAIASTQAAFQTVWTLVLFTMPRNNKNLNSSSQPNYFLNYTFILRAKQLTRTHNGKISKSHILLFFQEARQGGC